MTTQADIFGKLHGCFRCGTIQGDIALDLAGGTVVCKGCGEHAVVTFQQALDLLNDLHLSGTPILAQVAMLDPEEAFEGGELS